MWTCSVCLQANYLIFLLRQSRLIINIHFSTPGELPDTMASFYGEKDLPVDDGMPTIPPPPPQDGAVKEKPVSISRS